MTEGARIYRLIFPHEANPVAPRPWELMAPAPLAPEWQDLARACEAVIRETAHRVGCRCDCGATDVFKEARATWRIFQGGSGGRR